MNRKKIIAGNWKMNASKSSTNALITNILSGIGATQNKIIICVPFTYLSQAENLIKNSPIELGAQNLNLATNGAFTGEISGAMIADFNAKFVIVGHSERRNLYGESNEIVANKIQTALNCNLTPIFCIGEELADRKAEKTNEVLANQINAALEVVGIEAFKNIIVAYEPIWAIGTGVTATPEQAQETHKYIRSLLANLDQDIANKTSILYGGSMNPSNAKKLLEQNDIDGGLIGGASLNADDFLTICKVE